MTSMVRLHIASLGLSAAGLIVALYVLLRPPAVAPTSTGELSALRRDVEALRHSVELTRSQLGAPGDSVAVADAERRLGRLEALVRTLAARPAATTGPGEAPGPAEPNRDPMHDGSPRYTSLRTDSSAVRVEQMPSGALAVHNRDPALTGQSMVVRARTADGGEQEVSVTLPPPS